MYAFIASSLLGCYLNWFAFTVSAALYMKQSTTDHWAKSWFSHLFSDKLFIFQNHITFSSISESLLCCCKFKLYIRQRAAHVSTLTFDSISSTWKVVMLQWYATACIDLLSTISHSLPIDEKLCVLYDVCVSWSDASWLSTGDTSWLRKTSEPITGLRTTVTIKKLDVKDDLQM